MKGSSIFMFRYVRQIYPTIFREVGELFCLVYIFFLFCKRVHNDVYASEYKVQQAGKYGYFQIWFV